jgi:hypothetical protein
MFPAGDIWSVVMESPMFNKQYPSTMSFILTGSGYSVWKKGGLWI